jgi:hypothetical protein
MAFINGLYVFVKDENYTGDMQASSHPVEDGIDITDTVKENPPELSLSGAIIDYEVGTKKYTAANILSQIEGLKRAGTLITYNGRRAMTSMQIINFQTGHENTIMGGCSFEMTLKSCRIVSNSYVAPVESSVKDGGKQQTDKGDNSEVWYTTKKNDCVAALVAEPNAPYKNLKREGAKSGYMGACNWVMDKNPSAFSRKGDLSSLQIGKKILVGTR